MIVKKIKLENIRSFLNQEIEFPEGSILLSGDVGSGKSTVLLAIEFALFGIGKGFLSGASLLRNGKNRGSVELDLLIGDKEVSIRRNLKRTSDSINQDSGHVIINGKRQELTAIEIKQLVLDLLNYSQEALTKSKSLIYRYTVYTPQEDMKQILLGDRDLRLDTLRRVFGIDMYKRIKENTKIITSRIKEKRKELEGTISSLPEKQEQKRILEESLSNLDLEIKKLSSLTGSISNKIKEKNSYLKELESDIKRLNNLKKDLEINELNLKNKILERKKIMEETKELEKTIDKIEKEEEIEEGTLTDLISSKEKDILLMTNTLKEIAYKISDFDIQIRNSQKIKKDISKIKECPLCRQEVNESHKCHIDEIEDNKIKVASENLKLYRGQEKEAEEKLELLKKQLSELENKKYQIKLTKLKIKSNEEKQNKIVKLNSVLESIKKEIGYTNVENSGLLKSIESFKDVEDKYERSKEELEFLKGKGTDLEIQHSRLDTKMFEINKQILPIEKEIAKQLILKEKLNYIVNIQDWLETHFIKLVNTIERHIMLRVHADFTDLFDKWFKTLIETENLNVKLDEEFSPLIDQNGYQIEYENLSGGEKTAAALAYRLALNQVINNLISTINTNDIIILDEPTDGFSEDQLDRIRILLSELNLRQIIIVSHESKIESFVDTVIKFVKNDHTSEIIG